MMRAANITALAIVAARIRSKPVLARRLLDDSGAGLVAGVPVEPCVPLSALSPVVLVLLYVELP